MVWLIEERKLSARTEPPELQYNKFVDNKSHGNRQEKLNKNNKNRAIEKSAQMFKDTHLC